MLQSLFWGSHGVYGCLDVFDVFRFAFSIKWSVSGFGAACPQQQGSQLSGRNGRIWLGGMPLPGGITV